MPPLFFKRFGRFVDLFLGTLYCFLGAFLDRAYYLVLDTALLERITKQGRVAAKVDS